MSDRAPWGRRPRKAAERPRVYRVGDVNRAIKASLEDKFSDFWVEGELSEAKQAQSGHIYFTLSDEGEVAKIPGVMWKTDAMRSRVKVQAGDRVRMRANVTFYEAQGRVQLIARVMVPAGDGDLAARFEKLRKRLAVEGLMDAERKRPLPQLPRRIGVVTSLASAAMHDIVRVAHERAPVRLLLADCRTQGPDAPRSIVSALKAIARVDDVDVIILGRGGGSAEELWAFNDERVARAIAASPVPVVCGVGHESDTTIAELVADARASTPSNAAERAVSPHDQLEGSLREWERRLQRAHATTIDSARLRMASASGRLAQPSARLGQARKQTLELSQRARTAIQASLRTRRRALEHTGHRIAALNPRVALGNDRLRLAELDNRLRLAIREQLRDTRARLAALQLPSFSTLDRSRRLARQLERAEQGLRLQIARKKQSLSEHDRELHELGAQVLPPARERFSRAVASLSALSPLEVLGRGYAIAFDRAGHALTDADDVRAGDRVRIRLAKGEFEAEVG